VNFWSCVAELNASLSIFDHTPEKEAAACCHTFSVSCTQDSISKCDDTVILSLCNM